MSANGNVLIYVSKNVLREDEDLEVGENNLLLQQWIHIYIYIHMILTTDEDIEAAIIFIKSLLGLIDFGAVVYLAKDLERRDKGASNYLKFLLTNRQICFSSPRSGAVFSF